MNSSLLVRCVRLYVNGTSQKVVVVDEESQGGVYGKRLMLFNEKIKREGEKRQKKLHAPHTDHDRHDKKLNSNH